MIDYVPIHLDRRGEAIAIISPIDHAIIQNFSWELHKTRPSGEPGGMFYARGRRRLLWQKPYRIYLHRLIMMCVDPLEGFMVDHINGDSLDCRRSNLKWATARENRNNQRNTPEAKREAILRPRAYEAAGNGWRVLRGEYPGF